MKGESMLLGRLRYEHSARAWRAIFTGPVAGAAIIVVGAGVYLSMKYRIRIGADYRKKPGLIP
jgi:hypothetical protein